MGLHLLLSCVGYDTSCSSPSKTSQIFGVGCHFVIELTHFNFKNM